MDHQLISKNPINDSSLGMATINLRFLGISPALKLDAFEHLSFRKNYKFINSAFIRKSVLSVKSMKMVEHKTQSAFSPNAHIFQDQNYSQHVISTMQFLVFESFIFNQSTSFMSTSKFKLKVSNLDNKVTSSALEVGVGVFILKDDKILFGRRCSTSVADNTYGLPGGHLEFGESFEECAVREVKEETGLDIKNIEVLTITNNIVPLDAVHVIVIYMRAHLSDPNQTPKNIEPGKCEGWEWYDLNNLPEPIYEPLREMLQGGFNPFLTNSPNQIVA